MSVARALASPRRQGAGAEPSRKSKFRPEIQGLRSLAVLMVVSYHVWFGRVSGGVDVFLLISAFLMALQFVGKYEQGRPMALIKHWLHLFRRLLPAAVTVDRRHPGGKLHPPSPDPLAGHRRPGLGFPVLLRKRPAPGARSRLLRDRPQPGQSPPAFLVPVHPGPGFHSLAADLRRCRVPRPPVPAALPHPLWPTSSPGSSWCPSCTRSSSRSPTRRRRTSIPGPACGNSHSAPWWHSSCPGCGFRGRDASSWAGWACHRHARCGILLNVQAAFPGVAALWPTVAAAFVIAAGQTRKPASAWTGS